MPLLDLSFACGEPSLSVRSFSVREAVSALFSAQVTARSPSPELDLSAIVGDTASLRVETGLAFAALGGARTWTGVVRSMEQTHAEPSGLSTYAIHIVPSMWLLT